MKSVSKVILTSMMLLATMLYSCDKEIETSPVNVDESKTGTLTVYLYAELDQTNYGKEPVPAGTNVLLSIPYSKITGNPNATGNWEKTVAVDAQGKIEATVPTNSTGVSVTITPGDFTFAQVQPFLSTDQTVTKKFSYVVATATSYTVRADEKVVEVLDYNTITAFSDYDNYVVIKGKVVFDADATNNGDGSDAQKTWDPAPVGTVLTFYVTGSWSKTVALTNENGFSVYEITVPKGENIKFAYNFTYARKVGATTTETWRYKSTGTATTPANFSSNTDNVDLKLIELEKAN